LGRKHEIYLLSLLLERRSRACSNRLPKVEGTESARYTTTMRP
jgi:hypothetical protein